MGAIMSMTGRHDAGRRTVVVEERDVQVDPPVRRYL